MSSRREEILRAFIGLVERNGINRTTMQDVAREMGCSVGTIYNEYVNKEALIDAYANYALSVARASAEASVNEALPPPEQLQQLLLGHVQRIFLLVRENIAAMDVIGDVNTFRYIGKKNMNMRQEIRGILKNKIRQILESGVRQNLFAAMETAETAGAIVDAFTEYWSPPLIIGRTLEDVTRDAERMVDFVMKALKNGEMKNESTCNQQQSPGTPRVHPNIARQNSRGRDNLRR